MHVPFVHVAADWPLCKKRTPRSRATSTYPCAKDTSNSCVSSRGSRPHAAAVACCFARDEENRWNVRSIGLRMRPMGKLSLSLFALGVAACGSDNKGTADAGKTFMDAPPKVFMDAPPKVFMDAPPVNYDFTCFGVTPPTTADGPVTIAGTTDKFSMNGGSPLGGVTVETYKIGNATALDTKMSDATLGTFTTGNLVDGRRAAGWISQDIEAAYRTTYLYPPNKVIARPRRRAGADDVSGHVHSAQPVRRSRRTPRTACCSITVADCTFMPISGATLTAKQASANVGSILDLGALTMQSALERPVPRLQRARRRHDDRRELHHDDLPEPRRRGAQDPRQCRRRNADSQRRRSRSLISAC